MNFRLLLILTPFITLAVACKNNSKPTTAEILKEAAKSPNINVGNKNFTVMPPDGWTTKDTTLNGVAFYFLFAPTLEQNFRPNMNLLNESMQNFSLEEYQHKTLETMANTLVDFKALENGDIETAGVKGHWVHCQMTQSGLALEEILYIVPINGIAYLFAGTTKPGTMDKYRNSFDEIVKSFKLNS